MLFRLDFLREKLTKHQLASESVRSSLHGDCLDLDTILQEDIYCLGYVILYLMTNFYPEHSLSSADIANLLKVSSTIFSKKLLRLTQTMIEETTKNRITLKTLRDRLKN